MSALSRRATRACAASGSPSSSRRAARPTCPAAASPERCPLTCWRCASPTCWAPSSAPWARAKKDEVIAEILQEHQVTVRTLFDNMRELDPKLGKCWLMEFKFALSPEHKDKRMRAAERWLQLGVASGVAGLKQRQPLPPLDPAAPPPPPINISTEPGHLNAAWLQRIIWIDAKKFASRRHPTRCGARGERSRSSCRTGA